MKIAFVAYGDNSTKLIPTLVKQNWFCINNLATSREAKLDKTVWSTLLNAKLELDMFVIVTDDYIPYDMLRWAEFASLHGMEFRLNIDTVKWALNSYCDYPIGTRPDRKIMGKFKVARIQIEIDPVIARLMRASKQWEYLVQCHTQYYTRVREKREANEKLQRDYSTARLIYDFTPMDWKTVKRNAKIFSLPTLVWEIYKLLDKNEQHEVLTKELVPDFEDHRSFFRACWISKANWFISSVLHNAEYVPTGFNNIVELERFVQFWRPVYDISPSLTDIEAATSISYFLLMAVPPELRDIHLQLIPKESLSQ